MLVTVTMVRSAWRGSADPGVCAGMHMEMIAGVQVPAMVMMVGVT